MLPVEQYLKDLQEIHSTGGGVLETSYYPALSTLLNEIGRKLKPRVRCVPQLANTGAGSPDFGLYTENQFQSSKSEEPIAGMLPERGVIEVKGLADDSFVTAKGPQVSKYWGHYGQVLVTNYRDFVFIGRDGDNKPVKLETFSIAKSETEFWARAAHPRKAAHEIGGRFEDFLRRVMLHNAPLYEPEELAWFLASYAREARARVTEAASLPALKVLRTALEEALGLKFEGDKGDHFFRATLVQTLFYGVFSSWVLWCRENHRGKFDWHSAAWTLHVPMIATLFSQIAMPEKLKALGVAEVLDWAGMALNRVDEAEFFKRFEEQHAVQYFYEPFLKAYDPELRKELGVWYTPPEIVTYQVERVDRVLRDELKIPDGLADDHVVILDPCCGTGAYLVETLRRIHDTLHEKGGDALVAQRLKKAAIERVFGFEILPAPFVVAHLQLGLMLRQLGAPLKPDSDERAGVFLTNALTGWEPPKDPKNQLPLPFPELQEERDAANEVKQSEPILVILGNPPYNGFAGAALEEERDLVTAYRQTKKAPAPEGQGLNDLYVRFFRVAERRIVDYTGKGVVCYISNYSWLEGLSHTGMRERYLEVFDKIWIDCLNGDKYKTGKLTPWGDPDPSVFSTESNPVGIQVGTAIALLVKHGGTQAPKSVGPVPPPVIGSPISGKNMTAGGSGPTPETDQARIGTVRFRHVWGKGKRAEVLENAIGTKKAQYTGLNPPLTLGFPFMPVEIEHDYLSWPALPELFPVSFPGVKTSRDAFLVDTDRDELEKRIEDYFDPDIPDGELAQRYPSVMEERGRYNPVETRKYLLSRGRGPGRIVRYAYRPFDVRWLYWDPETDLLDRERSEYFPHVFEGNVWIAAARHHRRGFDPPVVCAHLGCLHLYERGANMFPLCLQNACSSSDLFSSDNAGSKLNLSDGTNSYLKRISLEAPLLSYHVLATAFSTNYISENSFALRQDWPRIPLPAAREVLEASAALGRQVAALLDTERPVEGVTCGQLRPELRRIAVIRRVSSGIVGPVPSPVIGSPISGKNMTAGGSGPTPEGATPEGTTPEGTTPAALQLHPDEGDLDVTAGWGHGGKGGVCMPGKGRYDARKPSQEEAHPAFGDTAYDVFLNGVAFWANVPKPVWDYTIGGYQVIKKWLSYREKAVLGRGLRLEEALYVTEMARRIAALVLLQPELNANYERVKADTHDWGGG